MAVVKALAMQHWQLPLETTVINNVEYATVAQVREMGMIATRDGAKQGSSPHHAYVAKQS